MISPTSWNAMPTMAHILPVLILLSDDGLYTPGFALYKAMSLLANTKAMMPVIKQTTIDKMPSTKTAVALGKGGKNCCGLGDK